jgi:hypothetical protein
VTGAALFRLQNEPDPAVLDILANTVGLMAHDDEDPFRGSDSARGVDGVADQRLAAGAVEDLGPVRFHSRAQAGGEDHYSYITLHGDSSSKVSQACLFKRPL